MNMKKKTDPYCIAAVVFAVLAALSVVFILYNGSQSAEQSLSRSDAIVEQVQSAIRTDTANGAKPLNLSGFVRKSAHVIEYALLGLLAGLTALLWKHLHGRLHIACPIALIFAVSVADEYIQSFRQRSSQVKDIVIDVCGGLCGLLLAAAAYYAIRLLVRLIRKKKSASKA